MTLKHLKALISIYIKEDEYSIDIETRRRLYNESLILSSGVSAHPIKLTEKGKDILIKILESIL